MNSHARSLDLVFCTDRTHQSNKHSPIKQAAPIKQQSSTDSKHQSHKHNLTMLVIPFGGGGFGGGGFGGEGFGCGGNGGPPNWNWNWNPTWWQSGKTKKRNRQQLEDEDEDQDEESSEATNSKDIAKMIKQQILSCNLYILHIFCIVCSFN